MPENIVRTLVLFSCCLWLDEGNLFSNFILFCRYMCVTVYVLYKANFFNLPVHYLSRELNVAIDGECL